MRSKSLEGDADQPTLKRHLGAIQLISIGIGAIIGAGIFVITGQAAALYAGPSIALSFVIASFICVLAGLCYAELAALIPVSGGSYSYSYVALGEFPAWIVGWAITAQYLLSASTVAVGWSGYFTNILKDCGLTLSETFTRAPFFYNPATGWEMSGSLINLPAIALIALIALLISGGIRAAAHFNNLMVVIKLATVALFIAVGIFYVRAENWTPFIPENTGIFGEFGWSGVLRAAGLLFFAFIGFDTVSTLAQDSINPQRDLPRGILGSLGICTIAYILVALVLTGTVSYTLLNVPDPMAVALTALGPKLYWFGSAIKLAILAGLASVVLVQLLGQTRVFMAMSYDGLLPRRFSNQPFFSTFITAFVSMTIAGFLSVEVLGQLVSMATLFLFAIVCLGVLILRKTHPEFKRPFKVPLVPFVPLLGIVACISQMGFLPAATWVQMAGWLALGFLVYFCYGIRHSKLS